MTETQMNDQASIAGHNVDVPARFAGQQPSEPVYHTHADTPPPEPARPLPDCYYQPQAQHPPEYGSAPAPATAQDYYDYGPQPAYAIPDPENITPEVRAHIKNKLERDILGVPETPEEYELKTSKLQALYESLGDTDGAQYVQNIIKQALHDANIPAAAAQNITEAIEDIAYDALISDVSAANQRAEAESIAAFGGEEKFAEVKTKVANFLGSEKFKKLSGFDGVQVLNRLYRLQGAANDPLVLGAFAALIAVNEDMVRDRSSHVVSAHYNSPAPGTVRGDTVGLDTNDNIQMAYYSLKNPKDPLAKEWAKRTMHGE